MIHLCSPGYIYRCERSIKKLAYITELMLYYIVACRSEVLVITLNLWEAMTSPVTNQALDRDQETGYQPFDYSGSVFRSNTKWNHNTSRLILTTACTSLRQNERTVERALSCVSSCPVTFPISKKLAALHEFVWVGENGEIERDNEHCQTDIC